MAALSDLAAMGAEPLGVLIALGAPASWDATSMRCCTALATRARQRRRRSSAATPRASPVLTLGITVLGTATEPMRRDGARAG